jgi:hypothetical protein
VTNPPTAYRPAYRPAAIVADAAGAEPTRAQTDAYDAGRAAYGAGDPSTTCPHDPRSELGVLWLRGYVLARRDDQYGPTR